MSPGPLADLKALLYELYLQAGTPTLDEIVKWIVADQEATGSPGRDTVARIIGGTGMPPSQADVTTVATVLARAARWDPQDAARRARDLWVAARMVSTSTLAPENPASQADPRRLDDEHLRHLWAKTYIDMLQYQGGGMMEDPPEGATAQEWAVRGELTARAKAFASAEVWELWQKSALAHYAFSDYVSEEWPHWHVGAYDVEDEMEKDPEFQRLRQAMKEASKQLTERIRVELGVRSEQ